MSTRKRKNDDEELVELNEDELDDEEEVRMTCMLACNCQICLKKLTSYRINLKCGNNWTKLVTNTLPESMTKKTMVRTTTVKTTRKKMKRK